MAPSRRRAGRLRPLLDKLFVAFEAAPWLVQALLYLCTAPLLEALFYLHTASWREWRSSAPHNTHERADTAAVLAFYDRILAEEDADGLKLFLHGWFLEQPASPWQEPRYGNIREFVAWTLYGDAGERKPKQTSTVDRVMNQIEVVLGPLPAGRAERLVAMTYTREPLGRCHRPLVRSRACPRPTPPSSSAPHPPPSSLPGRLPLLLRSARRHPADVAAARLQLALRGEAALPPPARPARRRRHQRAARFPSRHRRGAALPAAAAAAGLSVGGAGAAAAPAARCAAARHARRGGTLHFCRHHHTPSHSSASASQALSTGFQPPAASRGRCGCPSSSVPSR